MQTERESLAILIPAHCSQKSLDATLQSVAAAERPCGIYAVIVDDGSLDALSVPTELMRGMPATILRFETNRGIVEALNAGLGVISGMAPTYVARIDVGDRIRQDRLFRQVEYLRSHPEVGIVGSHVQFVDEHGKAVFLFAVPAIDRKIRRAMHINSCLPHPSVTIRASILRDVGGYSAAFHAAEDYELFFRILERTKAASLPDPLTTMVLDPRGISMSQRALQLRSRLDVQLKYFDWRLMHSYLGLIITVTLMVVPNRLLIAVKRWRGASHY